MPQPQPDLDALRWNQIWMYPDLDVSRFGSTKLLLGLRYCTTFSMMIPIYLEDAAAAPARIFFLISDFLISW